MKDAEPILVQISKRYGLLQHKYGDVRCCPNCHTTLPKSEKKPDYLLSVLHTFVECKNNDSTGRWNWAQDIGPTGERQFQREFLNTRGGWLLVKLGEGRAPKGKAVWLFPWAYWRDNIENMLLERNLLSIRLEAVGQPNYKNYRPAATTLFDDKYRLEWVDGGWEIPVGHPFWLAIAKRLHEIEQVVEAKC